MTTHILSCIWIISGNYESNGGESWMTNMSEDATRAELYLTSFYFTVTTITTVGYGDFSASTNLEKTMCIFIMIVGVIAFSCASGSLTNYIAETDKRNETLDS